MKKFFISTNVGDVWTICLDLKGLALCSNLLIWTLYAPLGLSGRRTAETLNRLCFQEPISFPSACNTSSRVLLSSSHLSFEDVSSTPFFTLKPFPLILLAEGYFPSGLIGVSPAHTSSSFREASHYMNPTFLLPKVCFQNPACSFFAFSIHKTRKKVSCSPLPQSYSSREAAICVTSSSWWKAAFPRWDSNCPSW